MLQEFKAFINRGNVLDLAVAVIIGAAFGKITTSVTEDLIMPLVGFIFGGLDFSNYFLRLGPIPDGYTGSVSNYAALKAAGVAMIGFGQFVTVVVNFLIMAFVVFLLVRAATKIMTAAKPEEAPAAPAAEPADVVLLREIRDELRRSRGA